MNQAEEFNDALGLDGIIMTKLDGTAKGGIAMAVAEKLKLPILRVGVGEQVDDLQASTPRTSAARSWDWTEFTSSASDFRH